MLSNSARVDDKETDLNNGTYYMKSLKIFPYFSTGDINCLIHNCFGYQTAKALKSSIDIDAAFQC